MRLVSVWRRANPSQCKCQKCGASLSVRCVRPPSEGCVNGQFHVSPCASCDQSRAAKKRRNDRVKTLAPWLRTHTGNLSALHRRFREGMCLEALGFVSEQQVGPYRVDELHPTRKIIVESTVTPYTRTRRSTGHATPSSPRRARTPHARGGRPTRSASPRWRRSAIGCSWCGRATATRRARRRCGRSFARRMVDAPPAPHRRASVQPPWGTRTVPRRRA